MRVLLLLLVWLLAAGSAVASPTAEFEAPYAIRIMPGGEAVEVSGSFSWAVPQNLTAALASAPRVRTVRLDSPGGYIQPALQVAEIIRARGLDTYVPRMCASACTVVFLAGKDRFLAPDARLGFHQAHAPGVAPAYFDALLRATYQKAGVPDGFIDHVLRTPPQSIWFPDRPALRALRLTTGPAPAALVNADDTLARAWWQAMRLAPATPDATLVTFAGTFSLLLERLQAGDPEACWGFLHNLPTDLQAALKPDVLGAMAVIEAQVRDQAHGASAPPADRAELTALVRSLHAEGGGAALAALRPNEDHAGFCPAFRLLLGAATGLAEGKRGPALRSLLAGG
jgi:hypothetical protein